MTSGIYAITNIETSQVYIGSSKNIEQRFKQHKTLLNKGTHHSYKLQKAWNDHSSDSFVLSVLQEVEELTSLIEIEQQFIDQYKAWRDYNINKDASGGKSCDPTNPLCPDCENQTKQKRRNQDGQQIYVCSRCGWTNTRKPKLSRDYLLFQASRKRRNGSKELYVNDYKAIACHLAIQYFKLPENQGRSIDLSEMIGGEEWMYPCEQLIKDLERLAIDLKALKMGQHRL